VLVVLADWHFFWENLVEKFVELDGPLDVLIYLVEVRERDPSKG